MDRNNRMKGWAAVLFAAVLLAGGSSEAAMQDSRITTKVKLVLLTSRHVHGTPIDVDTDQGRVTLYGRVGTEHERRQAVSVARGVRGVVTVHSELEVERER